MLPYPLHPGAHAEKPMNFYASIFRNSNRMHCRSPSGAPGFTGATLQMDKTDLGGLKRPHAIE